MKIKREYLIELAIWLFILLALSALLFGVYYYFLIHKNSYTLHFEDIDGTIKGSPVRFMGIVVGHVRKLELNNHDILAQIVITKKGVKIPYGSRARVEFTGIAGSKSIEILPPQTDVYDGDIITQDPIRIKEFLDSFAVYNRAIGMLQYNTTKLANEYTFLATGGLPHTDAVHIDKVFDNIAAKQEKFSDMADNFNASVEKIGKVIDKINRFKSNFD